MIKYSFRAAALITGILVSAVVTVPASAQNFGLMPRGSCPTISPSASYTPTPPAHVQQQTAYNVTSSAATSTTREAPQRPKRRGFGSPF